VSRAFVKEDAAGDEPLPERRVSEHPNLVTPAGLAQLEASVRQLETERDTLSAAAPGDPVAGDRLRHVERDRRYFAARLATATVVDPAAGEADRAGFGATVVVREPDGRRRRLTIVGEDEADREAGRLSWVSPLGRALDGSRVGDTVTWRRPAGTLELTVESIERS
jgi:transcription elongation GreA/GreB family factor